MLITVNPESLSLSPGSEIILRNQSWQDYKDLLAIRKDKKLPKLYFNAQNQEIHLMSPLPSHVNRIDTLRDLVKSEIPPLLAIEIVSPDSIQRDYRYKRSEYAAVGIAEYWIVDPLEQKITVLTFNEGLYDEQVFFGETAIASSQFPELMINTKEIINFVSE